MIYGLLALVSIACVILTALLIRLSAESRRKVAEANEAVARMAAAGETYHLKLKALAESSGAGIVMIDARGIVVHANANAERMLGREPDSMRGHSLIQATLSAEMQDFVTRAAAGRASQTQDFTLQSATPRILRATAYPFYPGLSGAEEAMVVIVDVTELRRLETIRRDFVANVSHEMRTPLASIRAMAETLEDGALADREVAHKFLSTIIRESDRLARISEDLLILSDAESKEISMEKFDLESLLRDVVTQFKPRAQERGIELSLESSPPLLLRAARDQMEQVFVNLVDNAIKYTGPGGVIKVVAQSEGDSVRVEVQDTGIGIMDEHLPRIFERFYRVDKARSRESGGTGLGLSIVKNIVEAHGGEVSVSSQFNRGSTFTITLPNTEQTNLDVTYPRSV